MSRFAVSLAASVAFLTTAMLCDGPRVVADSKPLLRLTAFAVNPAGTGRANPQRLEIVINRWSTDEQRATLIDALTTKGSDALLNGLQKIKPEAGYIQRDGRLGWHVQYAREYPLPNGGKRVVFATDRPMSFGEVMSGDRSADYEFMLAEIHLDANAKGEGKLVPAAKIGFNKETKVIEVENYTNLPVTLSDVKVEKKS